MKRPSWKLGLAILGIGGCGLPAAVCAQPLWLERETRPVLSLELLKPLYVADAYSGASESFGTSAAFLSARIPAGEKVQVVLDLPYSHFSWGPSPEVNSSSLGNPYLGLEFGAVEESGWIEFGARLPLASRDEEYALLNGILADNHRQFAFLPDYLQVQAAGNLRFRHDTGLYVRGRLGPEFLIPSGEIGEFAEPELAVHYALLFGYSNPALHAGVGLVGLALVSVAGVDASDATQHQVQFQMAAGPWRVRPAVYAHVWLDQDVRGFTSGTIGLGLDVRL